MATSDSACRHVQWGTVHVLEFRVGYNSNAVPTSGGPPIGLIAAPIRAFAFELDQHAHVHLAAAPSETEQLHQQHDAAKPARWMSPTERVHLLKQMHGYGAEEIALMCRIVRATHDSRARSRIALELDEAIALGDLEALQRIASRMLARSRAAATELASTSASASASESTPGSISISSVSAANSNPQAPSTVEVVA